ncbi:MAG: hypothetical protein O2963_03680 [Proteobacteria bacterium]|nr:hypothetical protein [Pseudomonadota bacterium]
MCKLFYILALVYVLVLDSAVAAESNSSLFDTPTHIAQTDNITHTKYFFKSFVTDNFSNNMSKDLSGETDGQEFLLPSKFIKDRFNRNIDEHNKSDKKAQALDYH